nr:restriction endonuclease subunit S [Streptomyces sp. NBC_00886]
MNVTRDGAIDVTDGRYVSEDSGRRIEKGDVLFNNTNSPVLVGKTALYRGPEPAAFSNHMTRLRPPREIDAAFLAMQLHWLWRVGFFQKILNNHVNQASVATKKLLEVEIVVPPLAEQHRVVEVLEGHLSRLDAAVKALRLTRSRSRSLKRSLVEQAMTGALSEQDSRPLSIDSLLDKIKFEVDAASRKQKKRNLAVSLSPAITVPDHWAIRSLESISLVIEYGTSSKTHQDYSHGDVAVVRMGNIQDGYLDMSNLKYLPNYHPDTTNLLLQDGDLLFNRTNSAELVGKSAVYRESLGAATFASYLIRCRLATDVEPEWVNLCINSPEGRRYINSVVSQQVGQANVNGTKLRAFPIPLPPHEEQVAILKVVADWKAAIDRTAEVTIRAVQRAEHLRLALLRAAFAGELAAQDPADEPASKLLARLQTERAVQPRRTRRTPLRARAAADVPPPPDTPSTPLPPTAIQQEFEL